MKRAVVFTLVTLLILSLEAKSAPGGPRPTPPVTSFSRRMRLLRFRRSSDESTYKEQKYSPEPSCMEYGLGRKSSFARRYSIVEKLRVPESLRIASESHCRSVAR